MPFIMQEITALIGIATTLAIGAASPGPSFIMVARTSLCVSRNAGVCAAFGMGLGGLLYAVASLAGLQSVLQTVPALYLLLKIMGGLFLIYLGIKILLSAKKPLILIETESAAIQLSPTRSFLMGLSTQLSNPKTAIVYGGIFSVFLPSNPSWAFNVCTVVIVFFIETFWYALVAVALSSTQPRTLYLRCKTGIDRVAGGALTILGIKLAAISR
jgi:threonine/homoserine/homoserine lactone efflux protein